MLWNSILKTEFFIQGNSFKNVFCRLLAISFRPHCVDVIKTMSWLLMNLLKWVYLVAFTKGIILRDCQTSNISHTLVGDEIVDHSDAVGASPVGAAPTTSSFSTGLGSIPFFQFNSNSNSFTFNSNSNSNSFGMKNSNSNSFLSIPIPIPFYQFQFLFITSFSIPF